MVCCISAWRRWRSEYGGGVLGWLAEGGAASPQQSQELAETSLRETQVALNLGPMEEDDCIASLWGLLHEDGCPSPPRNCSYVSFLGEEGARLHVSSCPWRQWIEKKHSQENLRQRLSSVGSPTADYHEARRDSLDLK